MFGKRIKLFTLLGFEVRIDMSWLAIAILVVWSLSTGFFPFEYKGYSVATYWLMGLFGAMGLFLSIIVHELAHSLVARRHGMPMEGITLFIFGGVAEMKDEPRDPGAEFKMAIVGPLMSLALAALFYFLGALGYFVGLPDPVVAVVRYLMFINALLAIFNLIPAFPLDGGRVLRSILWAIKGNIRWATRISTGIGALFGFGLFGFGIWRMFFGNFIGGMWMIFIGLFLQNAAKMSYQQLIVRKALEGETIEQFMNADPVTVSPRTSIAQLVGDYIYRYKYEVFPVVDSGELKGCVYMDQVKEVPQEERTARTVEDITRSCSEQTIIAPKTDAGEILSRMRNDSSSRYMVVDKGRLLGDISLKDMLRFLSMKMQLEERR